MSYSNIPEKIKLILIGKSGAKCEFRGCDKKILEETLTGKSGIYSNFAHIIADRANGPRGDKELSPKLAKEESNVMVLCFEHHKLIDENEKEYTVELLNEMKNEHENYINELMKIPKNNNIIAVKYSSSISDRIPIIPDDDIRNSVRKQKMYNEGKIIDLSGNTYSEKNNESFFRLEANNLKECFLENVRPLQKRDGNRKIYLYAIAPQPLLIYLGVLFSDISNVEVQQLQREPIQEWYLGNEDDEKFDVNVIVPEKKNEKVALNISITANIDEDRIRAIVGEKCDIIKIESTIHGNDIIKNKSQLEKYNKKIREVFETIKDTYGRDCKISIFPAMPISIAIETGRCWMKKTHPNLIIYDEKKGFKKALEIKYEGEEG